MYECRANDEYVSFIGGKLFWLLQLGYLVLPSLFIIATILISPVLYQVDFGRVAILLSLFMGGVTNLFFFIRVAIGIFDEI